jgi:hypothetical protein
MARSIEMTIQKGYKNLGVLQGYWTLESPIRILYWNFRLLIIKTLCRLVAPQGFEPRLIGSEPTVLPLNEGATD